MTAILLLALMLDGGPAIPAKTVVFDVVEWNHCYDDYGKKIFDQLIFWTFEKRHGWICEGYIVETNWKCHHLRLLPGGSFRRTLFLDLPGERGAAPYTIQGRSYRETWTQYDPEVEARQVVPIEQRRQWR